MCVEQCCTFDGVVESQKKVLSFRAVELALRHAFPAREVAEIVGTSVLPIQEHEVVPRGACVGAERGADRLVCACGPHQGANRRAECRCPCAADDERIKGRVGDQMVDIPVPPVMVVIVTVVQEAGEVGPTGTSATADRRARASAFNSGKDRRGGEVGPTKNACSGSTSKLWRCVIYK